MADGELIGFGRQAAGEIVKTVKTVRALVKNDPVPGRGNGNTSNAKLCKIVDVGEIGADGIQVVEFQMLTAEFTEEAGQQDLDTTDIDTPKQLFAGVRIGLFVEADQVWTIDWRNGRWWLGTLVSKSFGGSVRTFRLVDTLPAARVRDVPGDWQGPYDPTPSGDPPIIAEDHAIRAVPQRWRTETGEYTLFAELPGLWTTPSDPRAFDQSWVAENATDSSNNATEAPDMVDLYAPGGFHGFAFGHTDSTGDPDEPPTIDVDIRGGNGWLVNAVQDASGKWFVIGTGAHVLQGNVVDIGSGVKGVEIEEQGPWDIPTYRRRIPNLYMGDLAAFEIDDPVICLWDAADSRFIPTVDNQANTPGCGINISEGEISVDHQELIGEEEEHGLEVIDEEDPTCDKIGVKAGCHIVVDEFGVSVDLDSVIAVDAGLEVIPGTGEDCDTIGVKADCGITVGANGVGFDNAAVAGCGLQAGAGCTLEIDNTALAGTGLTAGTGCTLNVDLNLSAGCGIDITDEVVSVDRTDLIAAAGGLEIGGGTCDIKIKPACHITLGVDGVGVDVTSMIDDVTSGLKVVDGGACDELAVNLGCALDVNEDGEIDFLPSAAAGDGLEEEPATEVDCAKLKVKAGCGISVDTDGVAVNLNVLVSNGNNVSGLSVEPGEGEEPCSYIKVNTGCGLEINTGEVVVKRGDLMQADGGLVAGSGTCDMKVDLSNTSPLWSETMYCIPYVADVSWNESTCEMTKTMGYIYIPNNIPIVVNTTPCP